MYYKVFDNRVDVCVSTAATIAPTHVLFWPIITLLLNTITFLSHVLCFIRDLNTFPYFS